MNTSKSLGHYDQSGFDFVQEMLCGDNTAAINFDRVQKHPKLGYIIFEYLLCEEAQSVTPYSSHPNRYWNKNAIKFLSLWRIALDMNAKLYLVNYAKNGTKAADEVLLIEVLDIDKNGITKESCKRFTRQNFSDWFRELNKECLDEDTMLYDIYSHKSLDDISNYTMKYGQYEGETLREIAKKNYSYLTFLIEKKHRDYEIIKCYLDKLNCILM